MSPFLKIFQPPKSCISLTTQASHTLCSVNKSILVQTTHSMFNDITLTSSGILPHEMDTHKHIS